MKTTKHNLKQAHNGSYYCVDDLGMMCAGNWDTVDDWELHASKPSFYDGGTIWAIKRNDIGDKPVYMRMDNEAQAREWFDGMNRNEPKDFPKELKPELVCAKILWKPQG
ncbi:hypothetical protein SEA_DIRKDIRK_115 [Mycobacterium phage DirkDirk]|uniref:Uncharacterized protein n=1 Tax=Mycobacterium phage DirkDirk TaxID=2664225 RepID=A0A5Q2W9N2_9CAUD|nr:hypothetical protein KNU85_gp104 [Mycobacterium phage DirkDirk]QGH75216.1 hypothetical protein SEA_DIRKDIRK_115 [Mycobacterium phage DirkDirk]